jgi:hypothetical protein
MKPMPDNEDIIQLVNETWISSFQNNKKWLTEQELAAHENFRDNYKKFSLAYKTKIEKAVTKLELDFHLICSENKFLKPKLLRYVIYFITKRISIYRQVMRIDRLVKDIIIEWG